MSAAFSAIIRDIYERFYVRLVLVFDGELRDSLGVIAILSSSVAISRRRPEREDRWPWAAGGQSTQGSDSMANRFS